MNVNDIYRKEFLIQYNKTIHKDVDRSINVKFFFFARIKILLTLKQKKIKFHLKSN